MNREQIDIEALLIRIYYEKRVDRFGHSNERQQRILGRLIAGTAPRSAGGGFGPGLGVQSTGFAETMAARESNLWAQLDLAGDSLVAVHDIVLGLPTFYVEALGGLDFQVWDAATAVRMGHRITDGPTERTIQRIRRRGGKDAKRADELRAAGPARQLTAIEATTFLICHARAADRPFVPDVVVTGRRPLYKGAGKQAIGYEPVYDTPVAQMVEDRAIYATWHACLGMLVAACQHLPDLDVTGPLAPAAPWEAAPIVDVPPARRVRAPLPKAAPCRTGDGIKAAQGVVR